MKNVGIYMIKSNSLPNKFYIGSSVDIKARWYLHRRALEKGNHHAKKLQEHFNKFGMEDLSFLVITECEKDETVRLEQYYIDSLKPEFNAYKKVTHCRIAQVQADYWASILTNQKEKRWKQGACFYYTSCN